MKKYFVTFFIVLVLGLGISANLMAVDYYVDPAGTDDGSHGTGPGTNAWKTIEYAVNNVANPATATIVIHVSGDTYTLNNNDIYINRGFTNLTIDGAGAGSTIVQAQASAYGSAMVFYINTGETVTLRDMTIQNGVQGIYNYNSTLTIINCAISNNGTTAYGGGVYNYNTSTLTAINCTINGNKAQWNGGGVYNGDNNLNCSATLTNCTIFDNQTTTQFGGGIQNYRATMTLTNCTVTNNHAAYSFGGGVVNWYVDATIKIINTIIANNTCSGGDNDFYLYNGTVNDNGYNIVEYSSNYTFSATGDITGNQPSLNLSSTLADNNTTNGTKTLKTTSGSVAINAGTSVQGGHPVAIPTTDQRGASRNGATDIGAYEYWDDDGSLAVELSSFIATSFDGTVTLHWVTQTEVNNIGFAIYRSEEKDGKYTRIAFVNGAGSSGMPIDYQFVDEKVEAGKTYYYYLEDIDVAGVKNKNEIIKVVVPAKLAQPIPKEFRLHQNYPNPFNPETWLPYELAKNAPVVISIYNVKGQFVRKLELGSRQAGYYVTKDKAAYWDGKDNRGEKVASGVYWYTLRAGDFEATRRMVIVK